VVNEHKRINYLKQESLANAR